MQLRRGLLAVRRRLHRQPMLFTIHPRNRTLPHSHTHPFLTVLTPRHLRRLLHSTSRTQGMPTLMAVTVVIPGTRHILPIQQRRPRRSKQPSRRRLPARPCLPRRKRTPHRTRRATPGRRRSISCKPSTSGRCRAILRSLHHHRVGPRVAHLRHPL